MADTKIPKIIHLCWFGHGEYDEKMKHCLKTWEEFAPDYKVMKWDEDTFDLDSCTYVRQAYDKKRWAFVTDYVRFKVLQQYGGIYMDTDMELVKPLDDLLDNETVLSFKQQALGMKQFGLTSGIIMTKANNTLFNPLIEQFEARSYINESGEEDVTPIAKFLTDLLRDRGIRQDNTLQSIDGVTVYPNEYLCPTIDLDNNTGDVEVTENTYAIHHFTGTWRTPDIMEKIMEKVRNAKEGENVV